MLAVRSQQQEVCRRYKKFRCSPVTVQHIATRIEADLINSAIEQVEG